MTLKAASIVWKVLSYVSNYPFVSQSQDVHLRGVEGGPLPSAQEHSPSSPSPVCSSVWPLTSPVSAAGHGHNLQTQEARGRLEFYSGTVVPLTSLQFYVATDFTSEWSRTWSQPADSRGCLEFYSGTVMPPPPGHHHQSKEGHIIILTGSEDARSSTEGTLILHPPCHHQFSALAPTPKGNSILLLLFRRN